VAVGDWKNATISTRPTWCGRTAVSDPTQALLSVKEHGDRRVCGACIDVIVALFQAHRWDEPEAST